MVADIVLLLALIVLGGKQSGALRAARSAALSAFIAAEDGTGEVKKEINTVVKNGITERLDTIVESQVRIEDKVNELDSRVTKLEEQRV